MNYKKINENWQRYLLEQEQEVLEEAKAHEAIFWALFGLSTMLASAGMGAQVYNNLNNTKQPVEQTLNLEKSATEKATAQGIIKMPEQEFEWVEAPGAWGYVYVRPENIPDNYLLPTLGGEITAGRWKQEINDSVKSGSNETNLYLLFQLLYKTTGGSQYVGTGTGFQIHQKKEGSRYKMLPLTWSLRHAKFKEMAKVVLDDFFKKAEDAGVDPYSTNPDHMDQPTYEKTIKDLANKAEYELPS